MPLEAIPTMVHGVYVNCILHIYFYGDRLVGRVWYSDKGMGSMAEVQDFDSHWGVGGKIQFFFSKAPRRIPMPAHLSAHLMGAKGSFWGRFNQPGCEADSLPHSFAKVKNAWSYTSTLPYVRIKHRDNFTAHGVSNNCQSCEIVMEVGNPYAVFFIIN